MGNQYHEDIFDFDYDALIDTGMELLMLLPNSAYVKMANGELAEINDDYFIDSRETVYLYIFKYDMAIEIKDAKAYTENGMSVKFKKDKARFIDTM
jgi:predicted aspartyl protease